jgi:hypothetical protein
MQGTGGGLHELSRDGVRIDPTDLGVLARCAVLGFAGPFGSYEPFSDTATIVLTALMWLGRIEIIPVAVLLSRNYWRG